MVGHMKIVNSIPDRTSHGREARHDWSLLFDGVNRELVAGEDFDGAPINFGRQARRAASLRGVDVRVVTSDKQGRVWIGPA